MNFTASLIAVVKSRSDFTVSPINLSYPKTQKHLEKKDSAALSFLEDWYPLLTSSFPAPISKEMVVGENCINWQKNVLRWNSLTCFQLSLVKWRGNYQAALLCVHGVCIFWVAGTSYKNPCVVLGLTDISFQRIPPSSGAPVLFMPYSGASVQKW